MSLQRTREKRKVLAEVSLNIVEDVANQVHQFHHRVQISHNKMSATKYKIHMKFPRRMDG
jgi:hypothetical protein